MTTKQDSSWTLGDAPLPRPSAAKVALLLAAPLAWALLILAARAL